MSENIIEKCINEIAERNNGKITPAMVVAEAKRKDHPLHQFFEWDDRIAGNKYREDQARGYIRSVRVTITVENKPLRAVAYVRDPNAQPKEQGYIETRRLRTDDDRKREAIIKEFSNAASALERARLVALSLSDDVEDIDKMIEGVRGFSSSFSEARN